MVVYKVELHPGFRTLNDKMLEKKQENMQNQENNTNFTKEKRGFGQSANFWVKTTNFGVGEPNVCLMKEPLKQH